MRLRLNRLARRRRTAVPLCSQMAAMVSINDLADRPPRALADGERLTLGRHTLQWFDTPHVPHGWECGLLMDQTTGTFFCGDLFTQPGRGEEALTESDILGPSEAFRRSDGLLRPCAADGRNAAASGTSRLRARWPACTAARGAATAQRCCATWPNRCPHTHDRRDVEVLSPAHCSKALATHCAGSVSDS